MCFKVNCLLARSVPQASSLDIGNIFLFANFLISDCGNSFVRVSLFILFAISNFTLRCASVFFVFLSKNFKSLKLIPIGFLLYFDHLQYQMYCFSKIKQKISRDKYICRYRFSITSVFNFFLISFFHFFFKFL